ncbi:hypothetical protein V1477_011987 [Vespula maculifrons]|uniref:Uncharacterized protein n=1 Tax=Vespula maculifrons TaxID=7453 RepID=A0ABD2C0R5_VESMC
MLKMHRKVQGTKITTAGRYVHARPAINGLISVSFHLEYYTGDGSSAGRWRDEKVQEEKERDKEKGVVEFAICVLKLGTCSVALLKHRPSAFKKFCKECLLQGQLLRRLRLYAPSMPPVRSELCLVGWFTKLGLRRRRRRVGGGGEGEDGAK